MRRFLSVSFVFAVIASATVLVAASPAGACSCPGGIDDATAFERADAVFLARVDRFHDARAGASDSPAVVVLRVSDVFKGDVDQLQGVATAAAGASCGFTFAPGVSYVVFASGDGSFELEEGFYEVDLCSGTRPLGDDAPAFAAGPTAPNEGEPTIAAIQDQLGDTRTSLLPEAIILVAVLAFVLGLAAWFSRKNRPAI